MFPFDFLVHLLDFLRLLGHGVQGAEDDGEVRVVHLLGIGVALVLHHGVDGVHLAAEGGVEGVALRRGAAEEEGIYRGVVVLHRGLVHLEADVEQGAALRQLLAPEVDGLLGAVGVVFKAVPGGEGVGGGTCRRLGRHRIGEELGLHREGVVVARALLEYQGHDGLQGAVLVPRQVVHRYLWQGEGDAGDGDRLLGQGHGVAPVGGGVDVAPVALAALADHLALLVALFLVALVAVGELEPWQGLAGDVGQQPWRGGVLPPVARGQQVEPFAGQRIKAAAGRARGLRRAGLRHRCQPRQRQQRHRCRL